MVVVNSWQGCIFCHLRMWQKWDNGKFICISFRYLYYLVSDVYSKKVAWNLCRFWQTSGSVLMQNIPNNCMGQIQLQIISQLGENSRVNMEPELSWLSLKDPIFLSLVCKMNQIRILPPFTIHFSITFHLRLVLPNSLLPSFSILVMIRFLQMEYTSATEVFVSVLFLCYRLMTARYK
jgi:hypothetical protein